MGKTLKDNLLQESEHEFNTLLKRIESVPPRKRTLSIQTEERDKNFRDVVMHLYEWQAMLERWYREGMDGDMPIMPAPGYKWRMIKQLNQQIWENDQEVTLNQALKKLKLSHARVMELIQLHTDEELTTKKYYKWTKTSNLYTYMAANTSHHYKWAMKKVDAIALLIKEEQR